MPSLRYPTSAKAPGRTDLAAALPSDEADFLASSPEGNTTTGSLPEQLWRSYLPPNPSSRFSPPSRRSGRAKPPSRVVVPLLAEERTLPIGPSCLCRTPQLERSAVTQKRPPTATESSRHVSLSAPEGRNSCPSLLSTWECQLENQLGRHF